MKVAICLLVFVAIIAGSFAQYDSRVDCWGNDFTGVITDVPDIQFEHLDADASGSFVCGLTRNGDITCWGDDDHDQVTNTPSHDGNTPFEHIAVGGDHACALNNDGDVTCWGDNTDGQTFTGELNPFDRIAAGDAHTCGLVKNRNSNNVNNVECWGNDNVGQSSPPIDDNYDQLALGSSISCGRFDDNGQVTCWGAGSSTTFAQPSFSDSNDLAVGNDASCSVEHNGTLSCWGDDIFAVLILTDVPSGDNWEKVYVGDDFGCAIDHNHDVTCWGATGDSIVGSNFGQKYTSLAAGSNFVCGRRLEHFSPAQRPSSVFSALVNAF